MTYNDDSLRTKLSTLNETQESIVSVSQWITFHRRHADRIASVWLTRLRDSPPQKRLVYIYLVNDIVQNARARKRAEFPDAFAPLMPEAIQQAYRSAASDIQAKIRRVLEVWKTRNVFEEGILSAIQGRIDEVEKSKGSSGKKSLMGNSLFSAPSGSSMPKELETLGPLQNAVTKAALAANPLVDGATSDFAKLNDPNTAPPSQPVFAANLSSLIKKLASAEATVNESIEAQKKLIADLKRIVEAKEATLIKDEEIRADLEAKRAKTETSKREVEDLIMRGLTPTTEDIDPVEGDYLEPGRPDVEELTPEPEEPSGSASGKNLALHSILSGFGQRTGSDVSPPSTKTSSDSYNPGVNGSSAKKRKFSHDNEVDSVPDFGPMGVTPYDGMTDKNVSPNIMTTSSSIDDRMPQYDNTHTTIEEDIDALIKGRGMQ